MLVRGGRKSTETAVCYHLVGGESLRSGSLEQDKVKATKGVIFP